ncbi:tryptophan dimethylallyltransferase 2 [Magnaporthiopsis poae ATCC 64411]|uniref:Tryptophan dimethylallyltransferase 2 n=1 Tax=Magnaporthiopsis poae (strain ATCC 64411 / 73-15) TaxID=644358 RepID=A0A0C4E7H2_MAGP6|nr:tryptophan dimethylallyltransferase 2 [Magnaporthiopsis poae ATCC 64411]
MSALGPLVQLVVQRCGLLLAMLLRESGAYTVDLMSDQLRLRFGTTRARMRTDSLPGATMPPPLPLLKQAAGPGRRMPVEMLAIDNIDPADGAARIKIYLWPGRTAVLRPGSSVTASICNRKGGECISSYFPPSAHADHGP